MSYKRFSERLNASLDTIDMPHSHEERILAFSTLFKIPRYHAEALLSGASLPNEILLEKLAKELEINADWLIGKDEV